MCRARPALPRFWFSWSRLPTWPIVAMHRMLILRTSPEGRRTCACSPSLASSWAAVPAERTIWPPFPGISSMLWMVVPSGMLAIGRALPTLASAEEPATTTSPTRRPWGRSMYRFSPSR
jgi:hypothetical protein